MSFEPTDQDEISEEERDQKKKKRGRKSYRSISRTGTNVKLYVGNRAHIKKMVKELRSTDPNFSTESAAVRHYVNLGINAENAAGDLPNNLDNAILKRSQKEAVRNELLPLYNEVENLVDGFKYLTSEIRELFTDTVRRTEAMETKFDSHHEAVTDLLQSVQKTGEESLRNLIVLRSVCYVFLLGHKTGKIESGRENLVKWQSIVNLAHDKANQLSVAEVKMLAEDTLETNVIRNMAGEIFREIRSLPEPQME